MLRALLLDAGIEPTIHEAPFDRVMVELSDPDSELARFRPDITLVLTHDRWFLPDEWDPADLDALAAALTERLADLRTAVAGFLVRTPGQLLLHTVPLDEIEYRTVISFGSRAVLSRIWRLFNAELLATQEQVPGVYVTEFENLLPGLAGPVRDERLHQFATMAWSLGAEARYAGEATAFCRAAAGLSRKVLALDLDGTLWGGTLGELGPENIVTGRSYPGNCYREVQRRVKALRRQGVLLAIASKNDPGPVAEVLNGHPELLVRPDDFVAQAVDWSSKDDNLRSLAAELDLGLDSFVFADDSAFECGLVRARLPEVIVVPMAGEPSANALALLRDGNFATLSATPADHSRTGLYRARSERKRAAASYSSLAEYLESLDLRVDIRAADAYSLTRLIQLAGRTNQFTMTGHTSEARLRRLAGSVDGVVLSVAVRDRFGSEGIVGGAWISCTSERWLIENLILSCRVLSRGVEDAVIAHIADRATAAGVPLLDALFRDTGRNTPAASLYPRAGFTPYEKADGAVEYRLRLGPDLLVKPAWITVEADEVTSDA